MVEPYVLTHEVPILKYNIKKINLFIVEHK